MSSRKQQDPDIAAMSTFYAAMQGRPLAMQLIALEWLEARFQSDAKPTTGETGGPVA